MRLLIVEDDRDLNRQIAAALESIAPLQLAADWDNVGLLLGDGHFRPSHLPS